MTKLTIPLHNGDKWEVEATVVGDLALYESRKEPGKFSVTHVPTLLCIDSVVPNKVRGDDRKLCKWMRVVQEGVVRDWNQLRKDTPESMRKDPDLHMAARQRVRDFCRSVKV